LRRQREEEEEEEEEEVFGKCRECRGRDAMIRSRSLLHT